MEIKIKKYSKKKIIVPFVIAVSIFVLKLFPQFIEQYYIPYVFQPISKAFRFSFGRLPFSFGDIIYFFFIAFVLYKVLFFFSRKKYRGFFKRIKQNFGILTTLLWVYIIFNIIWGINYKRVPFQEKIQLAIIEPDSTTIKQFFISTLDSLKKYNYSAAAIETFNIHKNFNILQDAYSNLQNTYPSLEYKIPSFKTSLFSKPLSYMGFHGYYNPITAEAQMNKYIPKFFQPIVALHEMGHQLGYAQEDQANFIGFLAAEHSNNTVIKYSYHFDLLLYTIPLIKGIDSVFLKNTIANADTVVRMHLTEWKAFRKKHQSIFEDVSIWFYNKFLQINDKEKGVATYNEALFYIMEWRKQQHIK